MNASCTVAFIVAVAGTATIAAGADEPPTPNHTTTIAATVTAPPQAASAPPQQVREVAIESFGNLPVCRRHVPTGSRIATERCTAPQQELSAQQRADRDIMRRDIDSMRTQQMMQEQARQAAMAEALRRRSQ